MVSQVAWLNFDQAQQQRTQLLMNALSDQGTVDELGMGMLRDLVAGVLFPGHTVLHTRAKYLLFLPRDFRGLRSKTAENLEKEARRAEGKRIRLLRAYYEDEGLRNRGVIGYTTGTETKQLPSGSYWGLMRQLGIHKIKGAVWDYYRELAAHNAAQGQRAVLHSDDDDEMASAVHLWADIPDDDPDFNGFDLSPDEAKWLRDRFLRSDAVPSSERSLTTWLLEPDRTEWVDGLDNIWDHPSADAFPAATAEAMRLGRDADRLVFGARILYNYLCALGRPDDSERRDALIDRYTTAMDDWRQRDQSSLPSPERLDELDAWARAQLVSARASGAANFRWHRTVSFLREWRKVVSESTDLLTDDRAARLITTREGSVKPGRARLVQRDRLRNWEGDSGYFRVDYNWAPARRILEDIHEGLGTPVVEPRKEG